MISPNGNREDEYYWLRDDKRENPEMLAYLKAENEYADRMLAHIKALETRVYNEIIGRLQQDDSTRSVSHERLLVLPPLRDRQGVSDLRAPQGNEGSAPRKSCSTCNEMAKGHDFFEVGDIAVSPDSKLSPGPRIRSAGASTSCG